jgi:hypothetical protein
MKKFFVLVFVLSSFLLQAQTSGFNFVVLGDMPYTLPADYARFENLIREVNKQNQVFNVHVGDIKSSETDCSDESYNKIKNYFQQFEKPLIYTPGDNEWTDCNKHNPGKYDIEERLSAIRKLFFNGTTSLGKKTMPLTSQAKQPKYATYVENNRWEHQSIAFATFHIVGTNNNFVPDPAHHNREYYGRDSANIAWLNEVFDIAKKNNNKALVLFLHADMFNAGKDSKEANAFAVFKTKLTEKLAEFGKPVLLVNGDSHVFLVDKPLYEANGLKKSILNFTRLQVPGENNMHAVKVTINPATAAIFQIEELIVPGN